MRQDCDKKITIDTGNTRCKLHVWKNNEVAERFVFPINRENDIEKIIKDCGATGCAVINIERLGENTRDFLRGYFAENLVEVTGETPVPMKLSYKTPATLGADRLAAAVAVQAEEPACDVLIADCGSAMTLDFVDADANYMGGSISPGVRVRLSSLHSQIPALPAVEEKGDTPLLGYDTPTSIRSGVVMGMASQIIGTFLKLRKEKKNLCLIMTGGDAPLIKPFIDSDIVGEIKEYKDLVAKGLLLILDYNLQ